MSNSLTPETEQSLRELLKRCSPETVAAALRFRITKDPAGVDVVVLGIIERFLDPDVRPRLRSGGDGLRVFDDLGIDSLAMVEVVMVVVIVVVVI